MVPACAKLAHFGLWQEIVRDWDIAECLTWCQKVEPQFFYHKLSTSHMYNHTYSHISKNQKAKYHKFPDLENREIYEIWGFDFFKLWEYGWFARCLRFRPDLLTLPTTFNDVSVSYNRLSKTKMCQIWHQKRERTEIALFLIMYNVHQLNSPENDQNSHEIGLTGRSFWHNY